MNTIKKIQQQLQDNSILLYMKGSPKFPGCGFSARAAEILIQCNVPFSYVDILEHQDIREALPAFAEWPTFPQLWVNGELIGGSDIMFELFQSGELQEILQAAAASEEEE